MKYEKLEAGKTYWSVERRQMGNVKGLSSVYVYSVKIISLEPESRTAWVSWNGNKHTLWYEHRLKKLRAKEPELVRSAMGRARLMTREEKKAAKAAAEGIENTGGLVYGS